MKRTFQPSVLKRKRNHGFRARMATKMAARCSLVVVHVDVYVSRRKRIGATHYVPQISKSARLLNAHDYSQVFENCSIRAGSTAGTVLALPASDNRSRLGIIVAKKNVRLATDRNRIKRLVREYFRNHPFQPR